MSGAHLVRSLLIAAAVLATVAVASPAQAQRLSLAERVDRLEQQQGQGGNAVDLVNQIQALQSQVQQLQGQVEELKHQVDEASRRGKDQYLDLDSRIGRLEAHAPAGAPQPGAAAGQTPPQPPDIDLGGGHADNPPGAPPANAPHEMPPLRAHANVGELRDDERGDLDAPPPAGDGASADTGGDQAAYDAAFAALKDGRYAESARRFQQFVDHYPESSLAGNAYYWLGESYYATQNYEIALKSFDTLLQRYPDSQKAPDALLKVGYSQYELKKWDQAEATLNQVVETYPDTTVAHLAQGRLRALRTESRH